MAKIRFTNPRSTRIQRTTVSPSWDRPIFLVHRIRVPAPIIAGCGGSDVGCLDEALLHNSRVTRIINFGSLGTYTNFCVAGSILVASWASATLQLANVTERSACRVTWPCLLMKRAKRWRERRGSECYSLNHGSRQGCKDFADAGPARKKVSSCCLSIVRSARWAE